LQSGHAYLAPGDYHLTIERHAGGLRLRTNQDPPENYCRPAVDVLFQSVVKVFGASVLALVLTGMGQDGLRGCRAIKELGGRRSEDRRKQWDQSGRRQAVRDGQGVAHPRRACPDRWAC